MLAGLAVQLTGAWEQSIRGVAALNPSAARSPEGSRALRTKTLLPPQLEAPAHLLRALATPRPEGQPPAPLAQHLRSGDWRPDAVTLSAVPWSLLEQMLLCGGQDCEEKTSEKGVWSQG